MITSTWSEESRLECRGEDPPERSQPPRAKLWPAVPTAIWAFFAVWNLEFKFKAATPRPARATTVARVFRVLFEGLAGKCRERELGRGERKDASRHFFLTEDGAID